MSASGGWGGGAAAGDGSGQWLRPADALPHRLLVATRNRGKLVELRALLAAADVELLDLDAAGVPVSPAEDVVEAFGTFEENAIAKARYYRAASGGLPTIADDSGLEVRALDGAPGVRSRRWAGVEGSTSEVDAANNALLLASLADATDRRACFVCAAAYDDGTRTLVARGESCGEVLAAPAGQGGFGYDPLFYSAELGMTFAEAAAPAKNLVSHRARALARLREQLLAPAAPPSR